ncbi:MAG TPA: hypothetical protein VMR17_01430, partial [Xanthobacteraceae bacterium]|nr:hypothetical protein [Xanthobacteraceae bacterium]
EIASPGPLRSDTSSVRSSKYILDAAVAARGRPMRRLPAAMERTLVSVFFVARAGMFAFKIDILVYERTLTTENRLRTD